MPINVNLDDQLQQMYKDKMQAEAANTSSSMDYMTKEDKLVLDVGFNLVRVVDAPRNCESSFIKCDDGKKRLFKFPVIEEDPDFILYQILNQVLDQKYEGMDANGKHLFGTPIKDKHPDIYRMVHNNGDLVEGTYGPNGWGSWKKYNGTYQGTSSTTSCFMNVINRKGFTVKITWKEDDKEDEVKDYSKTWCKDNNHTLLLAKDIKSVGCPITVGNILLKTMYPNFGNFQRYDIAINRSKKDPYYEVFKADTLVQNEEVMSNLVQGDLTDEEKGFEVYDTAQLVKPSTYAFIYQNLKGKIADLDYALNTGYLTMLEQRVEAEGGKVSPKTTPETAPETSSEPEDPAAPASGVKPEEKPVETTADSEEKKVETPPERTPERPPERSKDEGSSEVLTKAKELGILAKTTDGTYMFDKLTDEQKGLIKGLDGANDKAEFTFSISDLASCPHCKKVQPLLWSEFCVYCGKSF